MLVMTDGDNNAGEYVPLAAADIARGYGMDVYAIGIGSNIARQQQEVGRIVQQTAYFHSAILRVGGLQEDQTRNKIQT